MQPVMQPDVSPLTVLLSVSNKTGLETFARTLVDAYQARLLATGGTYQYLLQAGLPVESLETFTGFEQLLGGRVKSLHPIVFSALLARDAAEAATLPLCIDVLVVDLYPFIQQPSIETIDIGGVAMLRAAAKNYKRVTVLSHANQRAQLLAELADAREDSLPGQTSLAFRKHAASQVFNAVASYDQAIARWLTKTEDATEDICEPLRYGENPHQSAHVTRADQALSHQVLQGKTLSYNNWLDTDAAWRLVSELACGAVQDSRFSTVCAIIKHNNPCGVAMAASPLIAWQQALACDSLSAFGGIVAFNQPIDVETAQALLDVFLEVIIAPEITQEAQGLLAQKKNLRVLRMPLLDVSQPQTDIRLLANGLQLKQTTPGLPSAYQSIPAFAKHCKNTDIAPEQWAALWFAWLVAKQAKSNAMVLARLTPMGLQTTGLGMGQTSRIGALNIACQQAGTHCAHSVLASDGFLPHIDNIEVAHAHGIKAIVQPGGSIQDAAVIAAANRVRLPLIFTGQREFKH